MTENLDYQFEENKFPSFLKVLCILTFIGAGFGLITALSGIFTLDSSIATLERSQETLRGSHNPLGNFSGQIQSMKKYGQISNILTILANALCLVGALLMWKLKKIGYFAYLAGSLSAFVPLYLLNSSNNEGMMGVIMGIVFIIQIMLIIAFIIMYTINFKHLKN
jgi:hypothetical protein